MIFHMSTRLKFPASDVGFGLSHIDHMTIGNILTIVIISAKL